MDRNYAYLRVVGSFEVGQVTAALGMRPAKCWNVGDLRKNGKAYDFSHWSTAEFEGEALDDAVRALVKFIEAEGLDLSRLPENAEATLQCVGHHEHQSPGFHFDAGLLRQVSRLGIAVDFDLYCYANT